MQIGHKMKINLFFLAFFSASLGHAQGVDQSPVKTKLESRLRYEESHDKDLVNRNSFTSFRLRPSMTYEMLSTKAVLEVQYAKAFGQLAYVPSGAAANAQTESSGNTGYSGDPLTARQAFLDIKINDQLNFIGGRQVLSYGDQNIISPSDSGIYGRTFDAIKLHWASGKWWADLFQSQIVDMDISTTSNGQSKELSGLYISGSPIDEIKALDLYYFYLSDKRTPTATTTADNNRPFFWGTYGTRIVSEISSIGFKVEYAQNYGQENSSTFTENKNNNMVIAEVSTKFGESAAHSVALEYNQAGKNWKELYPSTWSALGRADVVGRRNLAAVALKYSGKFSDQFSASLDIYSFRRVDKDSSISNNSGSVAYSTTSNSDDVGSEIDIGLKYQWDKSLAVSAGYANFMVGNYLKDSTTPVGDTRNPTYTFVSFEAKY